MSAFIISKPTMDHVVTTIDRHFNHCHEPGRFGGVSLSVTNADNIPSGLGQALYALNLDAMLQRYPGDTKETAPGPCDISDIHDNYRHSLSFGMWSPIVGLKAIRCLLYQCGEGNVPETELYQALDTLSNTLARNIVSDMPEYDQAPWDSAA